MTETLFPVPISSLWLPHGHSLTEAITKLEVELFQLLQKSPVLYSALLIQTLNLYLPLLFVPSLSFSSLFQVVAFPLA